jgi:MOSC domain-containing protein YiiM
MSAPRTEGDGAAIASVNVGRPRTVEWHGRLVTSAIWKEPVSGPVALAGVNLDGDDQADRRVHGGPDKAVYAYATEDYDWWAATTGPLAPGTFGENLTTTGIDLGACHIGDRWHVGTAVLEVAQPREPCFKLGIRMSDDAFPGAFASAGRPGAYLRIVTAGAVAAGDPIEVVPTERPAVRISSLTGDEIDEAVLRQAADDPRVPEGWRRAAARALSRAR